MNVLVKAATETPRGLFAYLGPQYKQAKRAAWDALHAAVPLEIVRVNESELYAEFPNGARVHLLGATDYNALRGMHLDGIALDEYALIDPAAWGSVIRPAIAIKRGFATFIGTPYGRNHFHTLYHAARADPEWFTAFYAYQASGVIAEDEIARARRDMSANQFAQEYECSWEAALEGAYYARQLDAARADGRIKAVSWEPAVPVDTWWDLGYSDATAVIFAQRLGREVHLIDYLEASGQGLEFYVREIARKPYLYGRHYLPHDAGAAQQGLEGQTLAQQGQRLGLRPVTVVGKTDVEAGIQQARQLFPRCWFDEQKCARLLDALGAYRQEWDKKRNDWRSDPLHDWASHGADAFRYLAITARDLTVPDAHWATTGARKPPKPARVAFEPYEYLHGTQR